MRSPNSAYDQHYIDGVEKLKSLREQLDQGKIDEVDLSRRAIVIAAEHMSGDKNFNAFLRDRLILAYALDRGDISRLQFDEALAEGTRRFEEASIKEIELNERLAIQKKELQRLKQQEAAARREAESALRRDAAARQAYADNQPLNPLGAILMMNMFNNSIQRNFPRPSHCASYDVAGTTHTDCY